MPWKHEREVILTRNRGTVFLRNLALILVVLLPTGAAIAIPGTAQAIDSCNTVAQGPYPTAWENNCVVGEGDSSNMVEAVQTILQDYYATAGYSACDPGGIDGDFGPNTLNAVECFQRHNNLTPDGAVGMNTWHALMLQIGEDPGNCNLEGWCNYNFSGFYDQFRMWVPSEIWYVVGLSGKFVQMNTGGPN
jgi:Putative peptidoglycan binding domain